jgi:hypothetical protein
MTTGRVFPADDSSNEIPPDTHLLESIIMEASDSSHPQQLQKRVKILRTLMDCTPPSRKDSAIYM